MSKKLTLNIDDELISFAHRYSKQNGVSISKIFEHYLSLLRSNTMENKLNARATRLYGLFQETPIPDKKELRKIFHEKNSD